jgi:hypothetical protein
MKPDLTPAEPGNLRALKHGATSERVVAAAAAILTENVVIEAPWLQSPIYQPAIARYARAEAVATLIADYVLRVGEEDPERIGARLIEASNSSLNTANRTAESLGLTPVSRARLALLVTSSESNAEGLARLAATGRASLARRNDLRVVEDDAEAIGRRKVELAERSDRSGLGQKPDQQSDRQPRNNDDQQPRNNDQNEPQRDV